MSQFPLVSPQWLKGRLDDPKTVVLDATYHLPNVNRDAKAEFLAEHIPGARFFDIDGVKDKTDPLPHMVPSPEDFAKVAAGLGISNDSHVVCYDAYGLFSAARPWWMFRLFGHDSVSVLDGGLPAWKAAGLPVDSGAPAPVTAGRFEASFRPELIRRLADVTANLTSKQDTILDARSAGRFDGTAPEPRPELRGGHIPGSLNLPFSDLVDPDTKRVKDIHALESSFRKAGIKLGRDKVVASCGSGVTACVLALGLSLLGDDTAAVYDGSWSEWGSRPDTPIDNPNGKQHP
ncbi:3-mercaptopyruvate sulfurtransferase [Rhodospirillaceae bacterium KN72]|uniref:Sulfurtransferase n=1 Tax=Pacificispira spongiicola TaxID=2729598 RepID=A0A7Y0DYY1_9PROT|nr:3-mercaptopyruvate sulfurtransferase [Pacificispira spongiicola]NMM44073.1 3-mercaptopyruvate sulfurtransferase [Pacificispira spongiicola]